MADRYLIEGSLTDGYLLEDGSGVLILEDVVTDVPGVALLHRIMTGMVTITAAGMGGVLEE